MIWLLWKNDSPGNKCNGRTWLRSLADSANEQPCLDWKSKLGSKTRRQRKAQTVCEAIDRNQIVWCEHTGLVMVQQVELHHKKVVQVQLESHGIRFIICYVDYYGIFSFDVYNAGSEKNITTVTNNKLNQEHCLQAWHAGPGYICYGRPGTLVDVVDVDGSMCTSWKEPNCIHCIQILTQWISRY